MNIYIVVALICSFLATIILCRYYRLFFGSSRTSAAAEMICYFVLFLINTVVYLKINIPLIILSVNIVTRFLITYLYDGKLRHRILLSLFFCIISALIEAAVVFLFTYTPIRIDAANQYSLIHIFGPVFSTVFLYLFVLILSRIKRQNTRIKLPFVHWILLLVIPLVSFYLILIIMSFEEANPRIVAVCCGLALILNFVAFYFYEIVVAFAVNKMEKQREEEKNRYYLRQLETMETFSESMRSFRHDLKNHTIAMKALLEKGQYAELKSYFADTFVEKALSYDSIHSGNAVIDSILNYKRQEAAKKEIILKTAVSVPVQLEIPASDLAVILGNLLDNAVEAVGTLTGERFVDVTLSYKKGCLYLSVKNPYEGQILKSGDRILTTKKDREFHGCGLRNVKSIVDKNGGTMRIRTGNQMFVVDLMLFDSKAFSDDK